MSRHTTVKYPALRELLLPVFEKTYGERRGNLRRHVVRHFVSRGEFISDHTVSLWFKGIHFPSQLCLTLLAEALGGDIGAALLKLEQPKGLVRRPPRGKQPKEEVMARPKRIYPVVRVTDDEGKTTFKAKITCAKCGEVEHFARTGRMECDEFFRTKGWETDHHTDRDRCPTCVGLRKPKLVASNIGQADTDGTSRAQEPVAEIPGPREMTKEDGRLLFREIEQVWDDHPGAEAYKAGWSDARLAGKLGVPLDWVKQIRERDYGGVGEDPAITEYVKEHMAVEKQFGMISAGMQELSASVAVYRRELETVAKKVDTELSRYRDRHNMLAERVKKLGEVAHRLQPPVETKAAG